MTREASYYIGLDLGQTNDYSALAIVEQSLWIPGTAVAPSGDLFRRMGVDASGWVSPTRLAP